MSSTWSTIGLAGMMLATLTLVTSPGPTSADVKATRTRAAVVAHGPATERTIAITIDDGYDPATCRRMADTLRAARVDATFFPIGKNVRAAPDLWAGIGRDFPLLNHTMYHGILPPLDTSRMVRQIKRGAGIIARVTGRRMPPYPRPPGGAWDDRVRVVARRLGVKALVAWDTTAADTGLRSKPSGMLRAAMRGRAGSIVLMHCNRPLSADLLPRIIAGYRARGFTFVTVPAMLEPGREPAERIGALHEMVSETTRITVRFRTLPS